jgi:nucleoside-diphosphate-sugar epimerase
VDEQFPTYPTTLYGKAKLATCWAALGLCQAYNIQGSWIRLFDPYGPGDDSYWLIPYLIREIASGNSPKLTKCEQLWDYLYVEDAAKAILSVAYTQATGIFNLGSGVAIPLKEVVETLKNFVDPTIQPEYGAVPYRPDQVMHLQADITRIKSLTGWEPQVNIEQGLLETVKGILK